MALDSAVGWLFYFQAMISCCNCLIKPDYNVAFSLLFYYLWKAEKTKENVRRILWLNVGLILFDVVWILVSIYMWGQSTDSEAMSLEGIAGAKKVVVYTSFVNVLLKAVTVIMLFARKSKEAQTACNSKIGSVRQM
eukprot:TRINITY_DN10840_c0_g2_i9.p1 TRINITY_DN10840_c0_g2~~TRINITY_DN10840_c0_g2_i9.p1  ORF type:complete len:136 (-),score=36.05 TRINITY_DN10840_c0_g2_i9:134-541(-)